MSEWEVNRHNGIWFDHEADDIKVSRGLAQKMRVVSRETDDAYEEFAVSQEDGDLLRDRLNAYEAEIASLRTQVETLNGWKEGALVGTAEMRKEVAFWRERAEAAERELGESKATVRLLQDMDADVCDCWAIRARAEAAEAKLARNE